MPIIEFLKTSDNTYKEVSATNPLPTTATISGGTVTADTELPAAAVLADGTANPTTTSVGSFLMGFTGATWERVHVATPSGALGSVLSLTTVGYNYAFNGTNWDLWRNNAQGTLLASAARTVNTTSPSQVNYNASGVLVTLNVTANPGAAETLSLQIRHIDPVSGTSAVLGNSGVVITAANGIRTFMLYPGAVETIANSELFIQGIALPRGWEAVVVHSAAGSWTYSLSFALIN